MLKGLVVKLTSVCGTREEGYYVVLERQREQQMIRKVGC